MSEVVITGFTQYSPGGLYEGSQAPQGAGGSAYDAMSSAKINILKDGEFTIVTYVSCEKPAY